MKPLPLVLGRTLLSIAAGAALLAGCASKAPQTPLPPPPVAAAFPFGDAATKDGTAAAELPWRQFFADTRLQRLIDIALTNNRDLRIAALNIEQARAQYDIRRADELPTVGAGISYSRTPTGPGTVNKLYSAGVQVTAYELDLFGRVRSLSDAALAQFLATEDARSAVQISLVASVANAAIALQGDDELIDITKQTLAGREESLRLTRLRFDNGATSQLDLRQAESLYEQAKVALSAAIRQRALDENALVLLLGQPLPTDLPAPKPIAVDPALPELPVGLPSEVLVRRPDVRQAERQLAAADANIGAARAAFFPRITLTGSVGSASRELSGLFKGGTFAWTFAPQLLQTIFDSGRNRGTLRSAELARDSAVAQYERAIQSAFREVADGLAGRATLGEQLRSLDAQVRAEADRTALAELRYKNGASSYLDVLDAQRSLFTAQQSQVQLQVQSAQNLVTLYRVLGGGWLADGAQSSASR